MNHDVLNEKIESLRNYLSRIESKLPFTTAEIKASLDMQDIISVNLERAVHTCIDIGTHLISNSNGPTPTTMSDTFIYLENLKLITAQTSQNMVKAVVYGI